MKDLCTCSIELGECWPCEMARFRARVAKRRGRESARRALVARIFEARRPPPSRIDLLERLLVGAAHPSEGTS